MYTVHLGSPAISLVLTEVFGKKKEEKDASPEGGVAGERNGEGARLLWLPVLVD